MQGFYYTVRRNTPGQALGQDLPTVRFREVGVTLESGHGWAPPSLTLASNSEAGVQGEGEEGLLRFSCPGTSHPTPHPPQVAHFLRMLVYAFAFSHLLLHSLEPEERITL